MKTVNLILDTIIYLYYSIMDQYFIVKYKIINLLIRIHVLNI